MGLFLLAARRAAAWPQIMDTPTLQQLRRIEIPVAHDELPVAQLDAEQLASLVASFDDLSPVDIDVLAPLLITKLLGTGGRGVHSQFGTPQSVSSELLAQAASTTMPGAVFDPACGIGGTLLKIVRMHQDVPILGADISHDAVIVAQLYAFVLGRSAEFWCADSLIDAPTSPVKAQTVIIEAPMTQHVDPECCARLSSVFDRNVTFPKQSNEAFILCALHHLAPDGHAYVLTSNNLGANKKATDFRRALLELGVVEAVVELPEKLLSYSPVGTLLWVLRQPTEHASATLIDARKQPQPQNNIGIWLQNIRADQDIDIPHKAVTPAIVADCGGSLIPSQVLDRVQGKIAEQHPLLQATRSIRHDLTALIGKPMPNYTSTTLAHLIEVGTITRIPGQFGTHTSDAPQLSARLFLPDENMYNLVDAPETTVLMQPGTYVVCDNNLRAPARLITIQPGQAYTLHQHASFLQVNTPDLAPEFLLFCINNNRRATKTSQVYIPQLPRDKQWYIMNAVKELRATQEILHEINTTVDNSITALLTAAPAKNLGRQASKS